MKRNLLVAVLLLTSIISKAQNHLTNVDVEIFYISDANDSIANDGISAVPGTLPVGSVTYRIYADLDSGYTFQAGYGVPGHELRLETSTLFYNNEDRGAPTANQIPQTYMKNNTVMLDSWFSVGAASSTKYGVMKSDDDGVTTVANVDGALQNADPRAGIPLTAQDGQIAGTPAPNTVTFVGFSSTETGMFDNSTFGNPNVLSNSNASWASLGGSIARPDSVNNKVLIGQFTTNGTFCYKLNIQIGTPTGGTENYVADSAVGNETLMPSLNMCFNPLTLNVRETTIPSSLLAVYPNPADNTITIDFNSSTESNIGYRVYDITGKILMDKEPAMISGRYIDHVDISSLPPGLYFIELSQNGKTFPKKIVKN